MSWSHLLELKDAEEIMVRFFYALIFSSFSQANCGSLIATERLQRFSLIIVIIIYINGRVFPWTVRENYVKRG